MKLSVFGCLVFFAAMASCTKSEFNPESQLNGGGTGGDPFPDDTGPVDDKHYAVDDVGRLISRNDDGTYYVRCNRGPDERRLTSVLLDSGNYCIQDKNTDSPSKTPASPAYFKNYQGRVVGKSFNNTDCSIEITPDSNGFVLLLKYKYMNIDYQETVHTSKFESNPMFNQLTASRNGPLSVSRVYRIGFDRYGKWLYLKSRAFSGGRLQCMNLKHALK